MNRLTQKMSGAQISINPLLEPLGFIKVLEWIFSIFSFATCGGYSGKTSFNVSCPSTRTVSASFGYPFRLNTVQFTKSSPLVCNTTWDEFHLVGDYSPSSQFYVSVAVFAFLYCIGALALYIGYIHSYRESRKLPMIDFVVTIIFAFLWLVSASAWAKGLTDVKTSTDPAHIIDTLKANCTPNLCTPGEGPSMGSLNVSVVFGFLNLILWAGNAWFVYKETRLSDTPSELPPPQGPGNVPSPSSM
ncbi:synaptophysin-like protein 1 [Ambystoma mexicanum]|uniref:synaptophysin-like protein 1 n=1 Tax=Ambystoma mexicanum TaxID=8296 RepID=UPI0037E8CC75